MRFIPACAGNRLIGDVFQTVAARGSSPRVRGTGTEVARLAELARFIPACAGNSLSVNH